MPSTSTVFFRVISRTFIYFILSLRLVHTKIPAPTPTHNPHSLIALTAANGFRLGLKTLVLKRLTLTRNQRCIVAKALTLVSFCVFWCSKYLTVANAAHQASELPGETAPSFVAVRRQLTNGIRQWHKDTHKRTLV